MFIRCAQDTQRKHTAGKFRQVEVTDSRAGIKRMVFTKELHSQATATPNMQQLMLTASAGPKVKPK